MQKVGREKSSDPRSNPESDPDHQKAAAYKREVPELQAKYFSPLRLFVSIIAGIFIAEVVAMLVVHFMEPVPYYQITIIDAGFMTVLVFPLLYLLSFRPLIRYIQKNQQAEEALLHAYDELEQRVQERTEELRIANSELEEEIVERKQAERAILRAKEEWERTFDAIPDLIAILDDRYRIVKVNKAMADRLGVTPREAVGLICFKCVHGTDGPPPFCPHARLLVDGQEHQAEVHKERLGGDFIVTVSPIYDDSGQMAGSVHVSHDISERRRAEEALRANEEQMRIVAETAPISISVSRLSDGEILFINSAHERDFGFAREELIGSRAPDLYCDPEDRAALVRTLREQGFVRDCEVRVKHKDGTPFWVATSVARIQLRGEQALVAASVDITARRQADEVLRSAHEELERRVQERTKELEIANQELLYEIYEREEVERQLRIQTTAMEAAANGILITDPQGDILWVNPAVTHMTGYAEGGLIGQNTRLFKSGKHDREFYQQMWSTVVSGQVWRGETINRRKDGSLYTEEQTITPVRDENGQISYFIAIKQDITEQKQAEMELERRNLELQALSVSERNQRQAAETLRAATQELTQSLDLDTVLSTLLKHVSALVDTDVASIGFVEDEMHLVARIVQDLRKRGDRDHTPIFPIDAKTDFFFQEVAALRKSQLVRDATRDPDWISYPGLEPIRSWMGVPILVNDRVIGMILLGKIEPGFFTPDHALSTEALASQAAVAVQNAWLFEQVRAGRERLQLLSRRLVEIQESERRYIARELHDQAGQSLTSLILGLGQLEKGSDINEEKREQTRELKHLANTIMEALHRLAVDLRPASLDHLGLVPALKQLIASFARTGQLEVKFKSVGLAEKNRLPPEIETTLYRIVQEALTNIIHHAQATHAEVILEKRDDTILLIVEDNGIGFDAGLSVDNDHIGLIGIRERAEMLGGILTVESIIGSGTTLVVEIPNAVPYLVS